MHLGFDQVDSVEEGAKLNRKLGKFLRKADTNEKVRGNYLEYAEIEALCLPA